MSSNVKKLLDEIRVYDCELTKTRLGRPGDGGYVVLRELCEKTPKVYSFGVGDDTSFEREFADRFPQAEIILHDPNVKELPSSDRRLSFLRYGIGLKYDRLSEVVEGSLLKMDIEWDEWATFLNFDEAELRRFSQLVVEFHLVHLVPEVDGHSPYFQQFHRDVAEKINEEMFGLYYEVLFKLNQAFRICHLHANNSLPPVQVNGLFFPPLLELTFVRKELIAAARPTAQSFPVPGLDHPNKIDRPDIVNYYPLGCHAE